MGRVVVAALGATVGALVAVTAVLLVTADPEVSAVPVSAPSASVTSVDACQQLQSELPETLADLPRRPTTPDSPRTAAYGDPPAVLRCGVAPAAGFTLGAQPYVVNGVSWFQDVGDDTVTWTTVDRTVPLEVVVPASIADQGALLVGLAPAILANLPPAPVEPLPLPSPTVGTTAR